MYGIQPHEGKNGDILGGGRVMEIDTFGPQALMGRPCCLSSTGK